MLVVAVGFFDACGGAAIALTARRAAKFVRVVGLQQIGLGMAGERVSVLIGLFAFEDMAAAVSLTGSRTPMWQDSQRSTMLASGTLIWRIFGSQASVLSSKPASCEGVRLTMCSDT